MSPHIFCLLLNVFGCRWAIINLNVARINFTASQFSQCFFYKFAVFFYNCQKDLNNKTHSHRNGVRLNGVRYFLAIFSHQKKFGSIANFIHFLTKLTLLLFYKTNTKRFSMQDTVIQTLGMLLDFRKTKKLSRSGSCFMTLFSSLVIPRVFTSQYPARKTFGIPLILTGINHCRAINRHQGVFFKKKFFEGVLK